VLYDQETNEILDTIFTNNNAQFAFVGKPNRNYQFVTLNGDSQLEYLPIHTIANQVDLNYLLAIGGRSRKQIDDSLQFIALSNQRKNDSILEMNLNNKFVVYYGFDKSFLSKSETRVLDSLLSRLKRDEKLNVVVGAFTDCIGSYKYNTILSNKRAKYVVNYLIKNKWVY
jgi:outer membrane protein OmpA-like peptidoglycan-associated protein